MSTTTTTKAPAKRAPAKAKATPELTAAKATDKKVRSAATKVDTALDELATLVSHAKATNVHTLLGFKSWQAYLTDVVSTNMPLLHAETRGPIVRLLANAGMSDRGIAETLGISHTQAGRDRKADAGVPQPKATLTDQAVTMLAKVRKAAESGQLSADDVARLKAELTATGRALAKVTHPAGNKAAA